MYYKLIESMGLRGWKESPYALRHFPSGETSFLSSQEFQALSFCNGVFDIDGAIVPPFCKEIIQKAAERGLVVSCEQREEISPKQEYKMYNCKYIRIAHWSITGKCNMNCRHCFMSAPQAKYGEISHEMAMSIVNQLADAGISQVNLTGGEPLVRQDFWEIVDALLEKEIDINQIYTNGLLVSDSLLDGFDKRKIKPEFSLSFDGVGWHDWLRGYPDAENLTIAAIERLVARGFAVSIESAFHKNSIGTITETMNLLAKLGVRRWKTNPVSGSGNWLKEGTSLDMTTDELYEAYLKFIPEYFAAGSPLSVQLGGFFYCKMGTKEILYPMKKSCMSEDKILKLPLCLSARQVMYISAEARLLPCMPISGLPIQEEFPSLYEMSISEAMSDSLYLKRISTTIHELLDHQPECAVCEHRLQCGGGCRSAALMCNDGTDYLGVDSWCCRFFKGGYEAKINALIPTETEIKD